MNAKEILAELKTLGNPATRNIFLKHGANDDVFGVKVEDLKKIQKRIKKDHELSLALYETGNSDAMYLAGLIADAQKITPEDLVHWAKNAPWNMISEYTVPWVAADSGHGYELGIRWIDDAEPHIASCGWAALSSHVSITADEKLDIPAFEKLLERVVKEIHTAPNRVRYTMNNFVISVGSYLPALTKKAIEAGKKIGKVQVEMGGTACNVPLIADYIAKVEARGKIGIKRKMARC